MTTTGSSARLGMRVTQAAFDVDTRPVPDALRYTANDQTDTTDIAVERYTSPAFAQLEMDKLWSRVWQFACLEQDIPEVGDHVIYDIGPMSYLVIRTEPETIRAYVNACLHRARLLRDKDGRIPEIRCTYHGWTWNLDGTMKTLPCEWDFPHVNKNEMNLPEAQVDTWRGFVFLNPDPSAGSLREFLGDLDEKWIWAVEDKHKAVHVAKVLPLNWKAAQEAFMESYHVLATHPQILPHNNANAQVDAVSSQPHWNRMIDLNGVASAHVEGLFDEQDVLESFYEARAYYAGSEMRDLAMPDEMPQVPEGGTARAVLAEEFRKQLTAATGKDYSPYSDCEILDTVQYTVFPNFHPWGGLKGNICYRWRPNGLNPDSCIFETIMLTEYPGDKRPPACKVQWLNEDQQFCEIKELGLIGPVFDQDIENMVHVQRGMRATRKRGLTLAEYQESRIRHLHQTLDKWLNR